MKQGILITGLALTGVGVYVDASGSIFALTQGKIDLGNPYATSSLGTYSGIISLVGFLLILVGLWL